MAQDNTRADAEIRHLTDELFIATDQKDWAAARQLFADGEGLVRSAPPLARRAAQKGESDAATLALPGRPGGGGRPGAGVSR